MREPSIVLPRNRKSKLVAVLTASVANITLLSQPLARSQKHSLGLENYVSSHWQPVTTCLACH